MVARKLALMLAAGLAMAGAAQAQPAASLDDLFLAAGRGELAPLERALASEQDPNRRLLIGARIAASRGGTEAASLARLRAIAAGADPAQRRAALSILMTEALSTGAYADAARDGRALAAALDASSDEELRAGIARTADLAAALAGQPAQRIDGEIAQRSTPARIDRVGLPRIDINVNGTVQEAVFDTGAGFSVLSAETARRLGVRVLDGEARVGNGVQGTVPVRAGIADRLEIAGTTLRNVPFLIIDDAELTFPVPGGYDIKAILGLPVMRALGRLRMDASGSLSVLPPSTGAAMPSNLNGSGYDLYLEVAVDGRTVPMMLDTGATRTTLSTMYAAANPDAVARLETTEARQASAGGARIRRVATWRNAPLNVAGRGVVLPTLSVALPGDGPAGRDYGVVGEDLLRGFQSYEIDFRAMRLELGEPVAPRNPA
jgi:predicted aspartyl protease